MVVAYKGFYEDEDADTGKKRLRCKDFIFEEGKKYHKNHAKLCHCGFHACTYPLDVFQYYLPFNGSYTRKFHRVILDEVSEERSCDSKIVGKTITILEEISVKEMVEISKSFECTVVDPIQNLFNKFHNCEYEAGFLIKDKVETAAPIVEILSGTGYAYFDEETRMDRCFSYKKYDSENGQFTDGREYIRKADLIENYSYWKGIPTQNQLDEYYEKRREWIRNIKEKANENSNR